MIYIGALLSFICTIVGFIMVNRTGNYENKWGYMMCYGTYFLVIFSIISIFVGV